MSKTYNIKQVIVVIKALNMRKGKIAAQAAHASMKVFFDRKIEYFQASVPYAVDDPHQMLISLTHEMKEWVNGSFAKVCVSVDSEQELLDVYDKAREANLPCSLITDAGRTEFNGVPTKTVVAIGPANSEDIDKITGSLKLL